MWNDTWNDITKTNLPPQLRLTGRFHTEPQNLQISAELLQTPSLTWSYPTTILSHLLLKLLTIYSPGLKWSTGSPSHKIPPNITFPLYACVDDLITGNTCSIEAVDESDSSKKCRKEDYKRIENSSKIGSLITIRSRLNYVDFVNWKAKGIPFIDNVPLNRWWGNAGLRIVIWDERKEGREEVVSWIIYNEDVHGERD